MSTRTMSAFFNAQGEVEQSLARSRKAVEDFEKERVRLRKESAARLAAIEKENLRDLAFAHKVAFNLLSSALASTEKHLSGTLYDISRGVKSVKEAFSDLAQSVTRDMWRMISRQTAHYLMRGTVFGLSAWKEGGVMPGAFTPMATGGVFSRPTLGLVAEGKNAEAVVPLPNNRSIPVEMRSQSQPQPVTVVNVLDESMIEGVVSETLVKKSRVIVNMIGDDIRQGGVTYQSLKGMR